MFRLTREVRFAVTAQDDDQLSREPSNGFAGYPSVVGLAHWFALRATVAGELDPQSQYLLNIRQIDQQVRQRAIPIVMRRIRQGDFGSGAQVMRELLESLRHAWSPAVLEKLELALTPFMALEVRTSEHPMVRLSQKFEFSASHRLHNPQLSDQANQQIFGKCNHPQGHGHNYELQVTLVGEPDANGLLINVPAFERIVAETVIHKFDHKNLNVDLREFQQQIPSVENIARVIYRLLQPVLRQGKTSLASVTVWETSKTWCEYSEEPEDPAHSNNAARITAG